jgi:hypothetical protein
LDGARMGRLHEGDSRVAGNGEDDGSACEPDGASCPLVSVSSLMVGMSCRALIEALIAAVVGSLNGRLGGQGRVSGAAPEPVHDGHPQ